MAGIDWSATPLGPVRAWTSTLRTAVSICLESRYPLEILWGPEFIEIHNDALISHIGDKHPGCLGRPFRDVFPEIQDSFVPMLDQVLSGKGATYREDLLVHLRRHGYLEECFFTFSYGPIRQHPGGEVVGVWTASMETTRQVLGTRRMSCLRELADATVGRPSRDDVFTNAARVLERHTSDIPYCVILASEERAAAGAGAAPVLLPAAAAGVAEEQGRSGGCLSGIDAEGLVPELGDSAATGRTRITRHVLERLGLHRAFAEPPSTSAMVVPLTKSETSRPTGLFVAGMSDRLPVTDDYRAFVSLAAAQIAAAAMAAHALEMERTMAAEARRRALHDGLTGLPNRAALFERLPTTLKESEREHRPVGFLFIDLDGFKAVNDTLGHQAGDDLLREVAARLRRAVRPSDIVVRLAGDEFAVLCENITSNPAIEAIADRIIDNLAIPSGTGAECVTVTASVGIATTGPGITDADELVRAADSAMYAAKKRGRGCWEHFDRSMLMRRSQRGPPMPDAGDG
nr:GGDEF domain-containing protein [Frankia canadensis]